MSVEVKAARERSGYPPSLAVAENRRCQHFGALDGHFVAMGSLLTIRAYYNYVHIELTSYDELTHTAAA